MCNIIINFYDFTVLDVFRTAYRREHLHKLQFLHLHLLFYYNRIQTRRLLDRFQYVLHFVTL